MTTEREVLYVVLSGEAAVLKRRLERLAKRRSRKISAEAILALRRYIEEEERKEKLGPLPEDE